MLSVTKVQQRSHFLPSAGSTSTAIPDSVSANAPAGAAAFSTDAPEVIEDRLAKASYELTFAPKFDKVIVNDDLEKAQAETLEVLKEFLNA